MIWQCEDDRVYQLLSEHGPLRTRELRRALRLSHQGIRHVLDRLFEQGRIEEHPKETWHAVD